MAEPASLARLSDIERLYRLLDALSQCAGGARMLADRGRFRDWPERGVYFFFEPSELRTDSGTGPRIVRVGTHALSLRSRSTLVQRLNQHRGSLLGSGNHRGSIFRLLVGQALLTRGGLPICPSWGMRGSASDASACLGINRATLIVAEAPVEQAVSAYLGTTQILWISVDDEPGPKSLRGFIERNVIGLLSNYGRSAIDAPSTNWLGYATNRKRVVSSGLWNQRHVDETYDSRFLDTLELLIARSVRLE